MAKSIYPRTARLLKPDAYKQVFECGRKLKRGGLFLYVCPNQSQGARLGLAISKRSFASAVVRNRIKRIVRECFRLEQAALMGWDIVVMVKQLPNNSDNTRSKLPETELSPWVDNLWQMLCRA
jgi:ribonuclease P protein component